MSENVSRINLEGLSDESRERIAQGLGIIGTSDSIESRQPVKLPAPILSVNQDGLMFLPYRHSSDGSSL